LLVIASVSDDGTDSPSCAATLVSGVSCSGAATAEPTPNVNIAASAAVVATALFITPYPPVYFGVGEQQNTSLDRR
jgi:hypothetical protein